MTVIKATNLTKYYNDDFNSIRALINCNLEIDQGEFVVVTGSSGSGKSTLLHLLGGFDLPSSGKVYLNQKDMASLGEDERAFVCRQEIGYIFQNYHLFPDLSVYTNIILPSLLDHRDYDRDYFNEVVQALKLSKFIKKSPKHLSSAQQQCVAIARALVNQPRILLADEPTECLDDNIISVVLDLLMNSIQKYSQTLVMATHNPNMLLFADRLIRLKFGEITEDRVLHEKRIARVDN